MKGGRARARDLDTVSPAQPRATTLTEYAAALEWAVNFERQRILEAVLELPGVNLVEREAVVRVIR